MKIVCCKIFLLLITLSSCSKQDEGVQQKELQETIITSFNNYDLQNLQEKIQEIESPILRNVFYSELNFLRDGVLPNDLNSTPPVFKNLREEIIYAYTYGDHLKRRIGIRNTEKNVFEYYKIANIKAKEANDYFLIYESLKRINHFYQKHNKDVSSFRSYQEELTEYSNEPSADFWVNYYKMNLLLLDIYEKDLSVDLVTSENFDQLLKLCKSNSYHKGLVYQLQGIYFNLLIKDGNKGILYSEKAEQMYSQSSHHTAKSSLYGLPVNTALAKNNNEKYREAIETLKLNLSKIPETNSYLTIREFSAKGLKDAYKGLKIVDSVSYYTKLEEYYRKLRDEYKLASEIHKIDLEYEIAYKDNQISNLERLNNSFEKHKFTYGILIFVVLIIALYSFIRWYKSDLNSKKIKIKYENTVQEIDKIKKLTLKNHILLKNKSQIILDELIYIKSEGHYLNFFTTNQKEFVRGRLKEIIEKIPLNFVRCHQSYIVNKNYIRYISSTEITLKNGVNIPLSRKYKKAYFNNITD